MAIHWLKISNSIIQSECGTYRIKRLDRTHVIFAAEIKVSELCYLVTWITHTAQEAKDKCNADFEASLLC